MNKLAAIYDPYLDTLGGGERYCLTVAEFLVSQGYQVDIFWSGDQDVLTRAQTRFNLDLSSVNLVPDIFGTHPQSVDVVEDATDISHLSVSKKVPSSPISKITKFIQKIKVTQQYQLFFYLSDWSLPFLFSSNNLLHVQVPFVKNISFKEKVLNSLKLLFFKKIICNSEFTLKFAKNFFGKQCQILYPPVDVEKFSPSPNKENIILSVGRFDNILNSKKQDLMIDAFIKLSHQRPDFAWKLVLAGGSLEIPQNNVYLQHLITKASGYSIEFVVNPDFSKLKETYSLAKLYWHAAGFGVDEILHPENTEHFGIAPVEAMASGAVPLVVAKGGLPEIVTDGQNGFLWSTPEDLIAKTNLLIETPQKITEMSQLALSSINQFSKENFYKNLQQFL